MTIELLQLLSPKRKQETMCLYGEGVLTLIDLYQALHAFYCLFSLGGVCVTNELNDEKIGTCNFDFVFFDIS